MQRKKPYLVSWVYIYIYNILHFVSNISYGIEIWANIYKSNINIIMLLQTKIYKFQSKIEYGVSQGSDIWLVFINY